MRSCELGTLTIRFLLVQTRLDGVSIETFLAILWTDVLALGIVDADAQSEVVLCEPLLLILFLRINELRPRLARLIGKTRMGQKVPNPQPRQRPLVRLCVFHREDRLWDQECECPLAALLFRFRLL